MADTSQGILASILSAGNVARRQLQDLVSNPIEAVSQLLAQVQESGRGVSQTPEEQVASIREGADWSPARVDELLGNLAAPGVGGIIAGPKYAAALGLEDITKKATEMFAQGLSNHIIAQRTANELASMRNPGQAMSVFMGPDNIPRLVVGNQASKIVSGKQDVFRDIITPLLGGKEVQLSDVLLHPSLYEGSEAASKMKVRVNKDLEKGSAQYNPKENVIELAPYYKVPSELKNDPEEFLAQVLRHEIGHGVQIEEGMRTGTAPRTLNLLETVKDALTKGSFRSKDELNAMKEVLEKEAPSANFYDIINFDRLIKDYGRSYGEWEAEFGAKMNPSAFPMSYERKKTW